MKDELKGPKVENVSVAIVEVLVENEKVYYAYLLNLREDIMEGIIVSTTGYGENAQTGDKIRTSTLRHCIELLLPNEAAKIEPIMPEVFGLSNEYWVSFWVNDVMYDKRFVFPAESICSENMQMINTLGQKGVIIK
ncbi:MAG: hypothetical protein HOH34_06140 [Flavobacteriales bacterium]|jgi:hypothetical protein|nr:hypothetical protein [Flavobacteriales bacterium]MDA7761758.1 hypothetical protein [Crocinitomicaceae bacterium]MBT5932905.1 hypothetical protein [Flavobacteriales bacterium]MDB4340416.1 hypothetical protein [Crocinitomicaceae bacterium]MDC0272063.1 hypothetical protein [Crocinitomicaceae bacterium]